MAWMIAVIISSRNPGLLITVVTRTDCYRIHPLNIFSICATDLEVVKMLALHFAWSVKITECNIVRQLSYSWHSSSASTIMRTLKYMAGPDEKTSEISPRVICVGFFLWWS